MRLCVSVYILHQAAIQNKPHAVMMEDLVAETLCTQPENRGLHGAIPAQASIKPGFRMGIIYPSNIVANTESRMRKGFRTIAMKVGEPNGNGQIEGVQNSVSRG